MLHFAASELSQSSQWNDWFFNEQWNLADLLVPLEMFLAGTGNHVK